jgi:hypothetical protein
MATAADDFLFSEFVPYIIRVFSAIWHFISEKKQILLIERNGGKLLRFLIPLRGFFAAERKSQTFLSFFRVTHCKRKREQILENEK